MWIFTRPPDQLRQGDLQGLIRDRVQETVTLDFKREFYGGSDAEIRKMLRDVLALANANGGLLIIGMAGDGEATAAELVPVPNAEVEAQRLVASCAANIAERIVGLRALRIPTEGEDCIVVWVPQSYRKPHMITFQGATEFWIRHDRQNVRMSIAEIHAASAAREDLAVKVDQSIRSRLQTWEASGRELFALMATPLLLQDGRIDVTDRRLTQMLARVPEEKRQGGKWISDPVHSTVVPTLRDLAAYRGNPVIQSLEVYRSGHIEFLVLDLSLVVYRKTDAGPITITGWAIAEYINIFTRFAKDLRERASISDPYIFTLALRGCEGWVLYERGESEFSALGEPPPAWDETPNLLIESIVAPLDEDPSRTAQRIADRFWNAFHFTRCPFFDQDGKLTFR